MPLVAANKLMWHERQSLNCGPESLARLHCRNHFLHFAFVSSSSRSPKWHESNDRPTCSGLNTHDVLHRYNGFNHSAGEEV